MPRRRCVRQVAAMKGTGEPEGLPAHLKFATSKPDARAHQVAQAAPLHHPPLKPPVEQHEAHDW